MAKSEFFGLIMQSKFYIIIYKYINFYFYIFKIFYKISVEEIVDMIGMFKNEVKPPEAVWIEKNDIYENNDTSRDEIIRGLEI